MEQNAQLIARKAWHIMKIAYFLLRKTLSKRKLLLELKYLAMKRGKLAGKSLARKLAYHNHHHHHHFGGAYEFSCSNTPNHPNLFSFSHNVHNNSKKVRMHDKCYTHALNVYEEDERELHAVNRVLDMMLVVNNGPNGYVEGSPCPAYSPILPGFGFGQSPMVRQLRVTDSPYAFQNSEEEELGNYHVDEAAEEFIKRFYDQLSQQRILGA